MVKTFEGKPFVLPGVYGDAKCDEAKAVQKGA
jgi:hypothetical protein